MNYQVRLGKVGIFLGLIFALSGCNLTAQIQDLLETESQGPIQLKISDKSPYLIVNAANVEAKSISGTCTNNDGSVQIKLNSEALGTVTCDNNEWSIIHDFSSTPDSDNMALTVQETSVNGEALLDTAVVLKDTVPPQLTPLSSQLIPALPQTASWSCLNPLDLCQFRVQESESPAFVFISEGFNSTASASLSTLGIRYLYIQASDKAQNLSAAVQVQLYVGQPKIFIGALSKELTLSGIEDLNILAPASLPEMALFNNETCSGTANWVSTQNFVSEWALDPAAEGATAYVSVKFRTAAMQESACYHDSIQWPTYTTHTMCTSVSSSLARGRIVDSGGSAGPYQNNEICNLNLTLPGPTTFTFDVFDTEEDYDFLRIFDDSNQIFESSGTALPGSITTTSNNVRIEFNSDVSYTQAGFSIRWESADSGAGAAQTITLNNGDAIAVTNRVDVALSAPSQMFQTYLTEDPSCSAGGTWTAFVAATTWTFAEASSGPKELFVKFRDAFNQETFCSSAGITLELPEISIDYPATEDQIGNSLVIGGYCSAPNKQIQLSGTLTGTTTCAADQSWEYPLDTSALANNSAVAVTASLKDGSETVASDSKTYTVTRVLSIQTPASATTIGPTTQFSGSCNISDATIQITSPVTTTTTCTDGTWSASINVPGADGATITLTAQLLHNSVIQDTKSATYTLSTTPPTVEITGAPSGVSVMTSVNIGFGGTNVSSVRYKIGNSTDCSSSSGYSAETAAPTTKTIDISGLSNGNVTLCAVGKNAVNGLWQDFASASSVTWTKDSEVVATITSKNISVDEGTTNNTVTFTLSGTKTYDVKIYFDYFGRQVYMADHNLAPGFVTIPAGTLTASLNYDTFDNGLNDGDRDLRIYISHTDQSAVRIGPTSLVSHLIKDNDAVFKTVLKVVAARNNQCAIYSDNRLFCWGDNYYGQLGLGHKNRVGTLVEPLPGTTFMDVSITTQSICAITTAKKLKCWGYNYYGDLGIGNTTDQTSPVDVDSAENYVQVSLGANGACALTELGKVKCWGRNVNGTNGDGTTANSSTPQLIDAAVTYTSVHRKSGTACGITAAQELKCWGGNSYQQIITGSTSNVLTPTVVDAGTTYLSATGGTTICGITTGNKLKCWGWNNTSNVGAFAGTNPVVTRSTIDSGTNYIFVSDDNGYRCAITSDNDLKCWGEVRGTVSSNQTTLLTTPTTVNDGIKYSQLAMAGYGACGVSTDGQIVCMGDHYNNWFEPAIVFDMTLVDSDTTVADYGVGTAGACAIKSNGHAVCLGSHSGAGSTVSTPAVVDNGSSFTGGKAVPSNNGSCVINGSGQMFCNGANGFGAVGSGATESYVPYMSPVAHSISFANAARETFYCGYGISTSGTFYSWGSESACPNRNPTALDAATTYLPDTLAVADSLACAITTGNQLKCFGYDDGTGHLGGVSRNTPTLLDSGTQYRFVAVAYSLICGITTADKVKCWGANSTGKVGNGTTTNTGVPYTVDSTETFTKLSVGSGPVCAITSGQVLKCWGYWGDYTGNLTVTSPTVVNAGTSYLDIKVGGSSALGLTADGELHYWPAGRFDQAPMAVQPSVTFTSIKGHGAGYTFCALDTSSKLWCSKSRWDGTFVSTPRYMPYRRQ